MQRLEHGYDFVVVGGGLSGIAAALTAVQAGMKVALVQDRPVLGGCASTEIRVPPVGATNCNFAYIRETGLIEEILLENLYRNPTRHPEGWSLTLTNAVKREAGLDCYLNTAVDTVETNETGDRILAVSGFMTGSETRHTFRAPWFADCTGDGTVGFLAGAPFRMGIEARSEFGESLCAEEPQDYVMGCSMQLHAHDAGRPVPFTKPDWVDLTLDAEDFGPDRDICGGFMARKGGFWWLEWGGELDTVHDTVQIREQIHEIIYAAWDYLKNRSPIQDEIRTYELDWVGSIPGKRESRRLEGDHILSQVDIETQRHFDDAVAYGGWGFDDHPKEGFFSDEPSYHVYHKGPYAIPLRSLYSHRVTNMFMAGRNLSATHFGLSSTRVMLTCSQLGEAVGMAAAICARYDATPRQLVADGRVGEVQRALQRADHHIHALPYRDPTNLAATAEVTASSTLDAPSLERSTHTVPLDQDRLWQFPVSASNLGAVELLLDVVADTHLKVTLWEGAENGSTYPETSLMTTEVDVRPGDQQWVSVTLNQPIHTPGWHFLEVEANPRVQVHCGEHPPVGLMGYQVRTPDPIRPNPYSRWTRYGSAQVRQAYCFRISPQPGTYAAENVVNPWSRPYRQPNLWASAAADFTDPEWLTLAWDKAQSVRRVDLLFDSSLDFAFAQSWQGYPHRVMPALVRDYVLYTQDEDGGWRERIQIHENYQRHRTHTLEAEKVRGIKLEILATHGIDRAQVYGIRVY